MAEKVTDKEMLKYLKLATALATATLEDPDRASTIASKLTHDEMQGVLMVLATAAANPTTVYKLEMLCAHKSQQLAKPVVVDESTEPRAWKDAEARGENPFKGIR